MPSNPFDTNYFLGALQSKLQKQEILYSTFAKVKAISENGYYVDVETLFLVDNSKEIKNIPVIRNKYINFEIQQDDIVLLFLLDHLQGAYQEDKKLDIEIYNKSYLALPYCFLDDFQNHSEKYSNKGITINDTDNTYSINITKDNGILVSDKNDNNVIKIDSNGVSITSTAPIEIKTNESLYNLLNSILQFLQSSTTGNCVEGSPTSTINPASISTLTQYQSTLAQILK